MENKLKRILTLMIAVIIMVSSLFSLTSCNKEKRKGEPGAPGANGLTPYIAENGNWWIGNADTGVPAVAQNGRDGKDGADGNDGIWVTSFNINDNGELVVSFSNNTTQNLGKFVPDDGKDGVTPLIKIENGTWHYSYDNGTSWTDTGVRAEASDGEDGDDGIGISEIEIVNGSLIVTLSDGSVRDLGNVKGADGTNGKDGRDGTLPQIRINASTKQWQYYDVNTEAWIDLGCSAEGTPGKDGASPKIRIQGGTWWTSNDGGSTWVDTGVKAEATDGENGRGILAMEIIDGDLWVTYTDGSEPVNLGEICNCDSNSSQSDEYTDGLEFYPLGDGSEYGVSLGNAKYMATVVIPATYKGKPVTTIVESGFLPSGQSENTTLVRVELPESITCIKENAFRGCIALEYIVIPSGIAKIGVDAFSGVAKVSFKISQAEFESRGFDVNEMGSPEVEYDVQ